MRAGECVDERDIICAKGGNVVYTEGTVGGKDKK
jgi:hypothetical protein